MLFTQVNVNQNFKLSAARMRPTSRVHRNQLGHPGLTGPFLKKSCVAGWQRPDDPRPAWVARRRRVGAGSAPDWPQARLSPASDSASTESESARRPLAKARAAGWPAPLGPGPAGLSASRTVPVTRLGETGMSYFKSRVRVSSQSKKMEAH